MAKPATFFANFPVNKQPSTFEVIRRYRSTYEGCDLVPLVTSSIGDSELIIYFQEASARLFPNCYNKQGIQSHLPFYTPMNQGPICAKVYPEGIQPIRGNNCGLIPFRCSMARTRFALIWYFRMVANNAASHTLSNSFQKSMKI